MNRVVRTLLIWVMVLAMPLQSMAAATMWFCGPSHARMMHGLVAKAGGHVGHAGHGMPTDEAALPAAHAGHAGHRGHGGGTVHAAHAAHLAHAAAPAHDSLASGLAEHPHDGAAQAGEADPGLAAPQGGQFSCSACAACCAALALPARFALPEVPSPVQAVRATVAAPVASQPADTLERPPRTVTA